jgi:hypothetical protein
VSTPTPSTTRIPIPSSRKAISDIAVGTRLHDPGRVAKGRSSLATAHIAQAIQAELSRASITSEQTKLLTDLLSSVKPLPRRPLCRVAKKRGEQS